MDHVQQSALFLDNDPTDEQRWQALRLNNQVWLERWSRAAGGEVLRLGGLMCACNPVDNNAGIAILAVDRLRIGNQVDAMLAWCRDRHVLNSMICWYLLSSPPVDLAARLFARGFDPSWQPHWMWFELRHLQRDYAGSSTFEVQIVEGELACSVPDDLPNYRPDDLPILSELHRTHPQRVWQLVAFQEQCLVGRCLLHVTTGALGVAGLFSMGVVPAARGQGIGTALVQEACELALQLGCHHVTLNATAMGESVYRRVGFQSMGYGHTWFIRAQTLAGPPPTKDHVTFLEAVGLGDVAILDRVYECLGPMSFDEPSPRSLTPLDIAVRCQQPTSASWLIEHGARLDLISAWDLGWKEQLPSLLRMHPELVNLQRGEWSLTPLHVAVERGDIELAKLLLTVPNDFRIKDSAFEATALGWARYNGRMEILALIERHGEAL